jgi:hypothetical protein
MDGVGATYRSCDSEGWCLVGRGDTGVGGDMVSHSEIMK